MKVSIITATWNCGKYLESCLRSVREQDHPDIEHIVIDAGSTDQTQEIIDQYRDSIACYVREKDRGTYDALNKGIRLATGGVIGFLHADDMFVNSSVVGKIAGCFARAEIEGVYGDLIYVDSEDIGKVVRYWKSGPYDTSKLQSGWLPPHPTFYVRKEVYEKYGAFNISYRIAADYDVMLRFLLDKRIGVRYLPEILVRMRLGGASNRSLVNLIRKSREDFSIIRKHQIRFPALALLRKNISKIPQFISQPSKVEIGQA